MKKLLMIIPSLGIGGAEGVFCTLARELSRDFNVTIMTFSSSPINIPSVPIYTPKAKLSYLRWIARIILLIKLKRKSEVALSFLLGANVINAATFWCSKTIISERGSRNNDLLLNKNALKRIAVRILDYITHILANFTIYASNGVEFEFHSRLKYLKFRSITIEGAFDLGKLKQIDSHNSAQCLGLFDFITVSRLTRGKGVDFLVVVFSLVRRRFGKLRLLIVGEGEERSNLIAQCQELDLIVTHDVDDTAADVIFLGQLDDPLPIINRSRYYLSASLAEGLSNSLIEAYALGLTIFASDCEWGNRSILASPAVIGLTDRLNLPMHLEAGVLLPRINAPHAIDDWTREICGRLQGDAEALLSNVSAKSFRYSGAYRFSIQRNLKYWKMAINL